MNSFLNLFFVFFLYSFIGWIIETIYVSLKQGKISNRGFLIGPYCPIYGLSAVIMISTLSKYKNDILVLFIVGVFIASFLEYITSLLLEKIFKVRWWDYSNYILNIDGRVCFLNSFLFGILCVILIIYINPVLIKFVNHIPVNIANAVSIILLLLFICDTFISFKIIYNIKKTAFFKYNLRKDYTEEIAKKVKEKLFVESKTFRRIIKAFPNLNIINKFKN